MSDAPVDGNGEQWLLSAFGNRFKLMLYADDGDQPDSAKLAELQALQRDEIPVGLVVVHRGGAASAGVPALHDAQGMVAERFDARPGSAWLIRPDQHIAARWRDVSADKVRTAVARATAQQ